MEYKYGMLNRPFSIGCQPKGILRVEEGDKALWDVRDSKYGGFYWDILIYDRELTKEEINHFELERIIKGE